MAEDSVWFRTAAQLSAAGFARDGLDWIGEDRYVPLYEAKMMHQFDHRWVPHFSLSGVSVPIASLVFSWRSRASRR
jgi:hypothetical protein